MTTGRQQVARLWELVWDDQQLACSIYRTGAALELTIESREAVILSEGFNFEPRALSRIQALREDLKRRGWQVPPSRP
jgi:hypothetical protein